MLNDFNGFEQFFKNLKKYSYFFYVFTYFIHYQLPSKVYQNDHKTSSRYTNV